MATITKQMSIGEVLDIDRTTAPIMMEYGMHCMGCPFSMMETLEMGCAAHGTDADELVQRLNDYLAKRKRNFQINTGGNAPWITSSSFSSG